MPSRLLRFWELAPEARKWLVKAVLEKQHPEMFKSAMKGEKAFLERQAMHEERITKAIDDLVRIKEKYEYTPRMAAIENIRGRHGLRPSAYEDINKLRTTGEAPPATHEVLGTPHIGGFTEEPVKGVPYEPSISEAEKVHSLAERRVGEHPGYYPTRYRSVKKLREGMSIPTEPKARPKYVPQARKPLGPTLKPRGQMTKAQWSALMERVATRNLLGSAKATPIQEARTGKFGFNVERNPMATKVMEHTPPVESDWVRLQYPKWEGAEYMGRAAQDFPYEQGMEKFRELEKQGVEGVRSVSVPPMDVFNPKSGAYERRNFKSIQTQASREKRFVEEQIGEELPKAFKSDQSKGLLETRVQRLQTISAYSEDMWKQLVGRVNSEQGRFWVRSMEKSQTAKKAGKHAKLTPLEHFVRVVRKYIADPEDARRLYGPECKKLDMYFRDYNELVGKPIFEPGEAIVHTPKEK